LSVTASGVPVTQPGVLSVLAVPMSTISEKYDSLISPRNPDSGRLLAHA
jgi:hypothetical protein